MSQSTNLRTLTLKSKMKFGKYVDNSVFEIIFVLFQPSYIVWTYYNMSQISFTDDILTLVNITDKIQKPGKNVELGDKWKEEFKATKERPVLTVAEASYLKYKGKKVRLAKKVRADKTYAMTKSALMNNNRTRFL